VVLLLVLRGSEMARAELPLPAGAAAVDATRAVFWPPVLTLAALTFFRLPEALLILRLQDLGVSLVLIPLVWGGLHIVRTVASYPGGWLTDRIGSRVTVFAGGGLAAAVAVLMGLELAAPAAIATFLGFGLVAGLMESAERVLVTRLAPVRTGKGFGAYHAVVGIAALPAGLLFGWTYQHLGGSTALWISAAALGATLPVWLVVMKE
jgi:MFS family permease